MNFTQLEWEINLVPLLLNLGVDSYSTSLIGDNCFWFYYEIDTMLVDTTFTKRIKDCAFNVRTLVDQADSYTDIVTKFIEQPNQFECEYNELNGPNRQKWNFMSGRMPVDFLQRDRTFLSHCMGSIDWSFWLIPSDESIMDHKVWT